MSKVTLKFAELHAPLYMIGTKGTGYNLGLKLNPSMKQGLTLVYDRENQELTVGYQGGEMKVPKSSMHSWAEGEPVVSVPAAATQPNHAIEAQVETPFGHVFAGPGKGKTK